MIRLKRIKARTAERLKLTHKERIDKYNESLSKLSDHYDIPRVGPGWINNLYLSKYLCSHNVN